MKCTDCLRSCVVTSLIRLYYAVQYTKVPGTPSSLFEGMLDPVILMKYSYLQCRSYSILFGHALSRLSSS